MVILIYVKFAFGKMTLIKNLSRMMAMGLIMYHNYITFGTCDKNSIDNVRKPNHDGKRDASWKTSKEDSLQDNLFELKLACRKFKEGIYSIADLGRSLAWIAVPNEFALLVKDAENQLEMIRFCTSDYKQQKEADEVVRRLLEQLNIELKD